MPPKSVLSPRLSISVQNISNTPPQLFKTVKSPSNISKPELTPRESIQTTESTLTPRQLSPTV